MWARNAIGDWLRQDGATRWRVRGPILGKPMFWLYRNGNRYTPTGRYEDAVSFPTAKAATTYADTLTTQES